MGEPDGAAEDALEAAFGSVNASQSAGRQTETAVESKSGGLNVPGSLDLKSVNTPLGVTQGVTMHAVAATAPRLSIGQTSDRIHEEEPTPRPVGDPNDCCRLHEPQNLGKHLTSLGVAAGQERQADLSANAGLPVKHEPFGLPKEEVMRQARGLRLLNLYCGPVREKDGLDVYVKGWGAQIDGYDILISPEHDLLDEGRWSRIRASLEEGYYDSTGSASPCSTFCGARSYDGGPPPLRGEHPPEIYGLRYLTPEQKEVTRLSSRNSNGICVEITQTSLWVRQKSGLWVCRFRSFVVSCLACGSSASSLWVR